MHEVWYELREDGKYRVNKTVDRWGTVSSLREEKNNPKKHFFEMMAYILR